MDRVTTQARKISARLRAREEILAAVSWSARDPGQLAEMISADPVMAGQVLRTVNSPHYGLEQPASSILQAVVLLGHVEIRNAVWRTCVCEAMYVPDRAMGGLLDTLWRHAFTTARVTHAMARSLGLPRPEEISMAALLHDVGKFIGFHVWPVWTRVFYDPPRFSNRQRLAEEAEYLGTDHARLGAEVARSWALPSETCTTIEHHHAPTYISPQSVAGNRRAIAVVHLSDLLCHIAEPYLGGQEAWPVHLPVEGWVRVLGVREDLRAVCSENVIMALLPPTVDHREPLPRARAA